MFPARGCYSQLMSQQGDMRVALVHDELTRRGGAEAVFERLAHIFPQADLYSLYTGRPFMQVDGTLRPVRTSFLQRVPLWFRRHPSRLLPLLPYAAEQFDLAGYAIVVSSASAFAKGVVTRVNVPHICYCHTPTRYLWDTAHETLRARARLLRAPGAVLQHWLRLSDFAAAARVDFFLANSRYTQRRIQQYYRRESTVIHPPIDTAYFTPGSGGRGAHFLCVGRLTAHKHFDQAVRVCEKLGLPLVTVGVGTAETRLRRLAGRHVTFAGQVPPDRLRELMRRARALLQPGVEDFGMAAAEALACGTPVIAVGRGGVLDVVRHGETGVLYSEPREEALAEALRRLLMEGLTFPRERLQQSVLHFAATRFDRAITDFLRKVSATFTD